METSAPLVWHRGDWARLIRLFSMGATVMYAPLGMATAAGEPELGAALAAVHHVSAKHQPERSCVYR